MSDDALQVFGRWEELLHDLLDRTAQFPKKARFTFAARIDGLALDIVEDLVVARYSRGAEERAALKRADLALARMRILVRISHRRRYLDGRGYEHVSRGLDEVGRMLGAWRRGRQTNEGGQ